MSILEMTTTLYNAAVYDILVKEIKIPSPDYLMNRSRLGIPLREMLVHYFVSMKQGTLVVNLDGILEMTPSVAEEIGPILFEKFIEYRQLHEEVYLTYCNLTDEAAKALHVVFNSWKSNLESPPHPVVVAFKEFRGDIFLGHQFLGEAIPDALHDVLEIIYKKGQVTSNDLEEYGIKAPSRKLNQLFNEYPWLLRKCQQSIDASPNAWAYFYSPIVPSKYVS